MNLMALTFGAQRLCASVVRRGRDRNGPLRGEGVKDCNRMDVLLSEAGGSTSLGIYIDGLCASEMRHIIEVMELPSIV